MRTVSTTTDVFSDIITDIRAVEKFATEKCWFESHVSYKSEFHPPMKLQRGSIGIALLFP